LIQDPFTSSGEPAESSGQGTVSRDMEEWEGSGKGGSEWIGEEGSQK
jgi:hypothetical protein